MNIYQAAVAGTLQGLANHYANEVGPAGMSLKMRAKMAVDQAIEVQELLKDMEDRVFNAEREEDDPESEAALADAGAIDTEEVRDDGEES